MPTEFVRMDRAELTNNPLQVTALVEGRIPSKLPRGQGAVVLTRAPLGLAPLKIAGRG
ncbi:MAG: hypothetical protein WBO97_05635 [Tepidiformaceae bacterium]